MVQSFILHIAHRHHFSDPIKSCLPRAHAGSAAFRSPAIQPKPPPHLRSPNASNALILSLQPASH